MQKAIEPWAVKDLLGWQQLISFPEYQRESSVWGRSAKQALVDSMLRNFDIAALYFYSDDEDLVECIDGRQRIGAILSFFGENELDEEDNGFPLRIENEIYEDEDFVFAPLEGFTLAEIRRQFEQEHNELAGQFISHLESYKINVVLLEKSNDPAEFNLQFTRLNLGTIINSGEKLNATTGDMRALCFGEDGLSRHLFISRIKIPERRFSKEQLCAQIVAQCFSWLRDNEVQRTRHFDLQRLFKKYRNLEDREREWRQTIETLLTTLNECLANPNILRNRAITVSVVLLALELDLRPGARATLFGSFVEEFVCRLRWQVSKSKTFESDSEYRYLFNFQKHLTQASVEKSAVQGRARILMAEWLTFETTQQLAGDQGYIDAHPDQDPSALCRDFLQRAP